MWIIVPLIVVQLLIFAVLITLFRRIMNQNVVTATKHLDELNQDYQEKEKKVSVEIEKARLKAQETINQAEEEALKLKTEIVERTQKEREELIAQARTQADEIIQQADKSRKQLLMDIEDRIAKEGVVKACELIQVALPEELKRLVHEHWVEEVVAGGFQELQRLKISEDIQEIKVVSAFSLTEEQKKKIFNRLKDFFGQQIPLKEEVDPKVVAGIVIHIGSLVLDGSLKNKIQQNLR